MVEPIDDPLIEQSRDDADDRRVTYSPPVFRIAAWFRYRRTLCTYCHKHPRVVIDGVDLYCSAHCAEADADDQATG